MFLYIKPVISHFQMLIAHVIFFLLVTLAPTVTQCLPYNLSTVYTSTPSPFAVGGRIPPHARPFPRPYPPIPGLVMAPAFSLPAPHGVSGAEHKPSSTPHGGHGVEHRPSGTPHSDHGAEHRPSGTPHHHKHNNHHTSSADVERKLDAFFKLAHSRMESGADIRALAAGLLPLYIQLCVHVGDECNSLVADLFRARYNEVQMEADRMDRLQLVLRRLARARGRWGKRPMPPKAAMRRMRRPHMLEREEDD